MSQRFLARLAALAGGAALGLVVLAVVALYVGAWRTPAADGGATRQPATAEAAATPTLAPAPKLSPAPTRMPTPTPAPTLTPVPSAVRVNSLSELDRRASSLRGQLVQVVVGERELTDAADGYLRSQGIAATDVKVRLRPGKMVLTGTARQSIFSVGFEVTGHPTIVEGALKLAVDTVEPSLVSQVSQVAPGETIDLPLSFEARSADVVEGQMVVTGVVR